MNNLLPLLLICAGLAALSGLFCSSAAAATDHASLSTWTSVFSWRLTPDGEWLVYLQVTRPLGGSRAAGEAVVVVRQDAGPSGSASPQLVAYYVPRLAGTAGDDAPVGSAAPAGLATRSALDETELRAFLRRRLPE